MWLIPVIEDGGGGGPTTVITGLAGEVDTAPVQGRVKQRASALAPEVDVGLASTRRKVRTTGAPAAEVDSGLAAVLPQRVTTGLATEADVGLLAGRQHVRSTALALETDTGLAALRVKQATTGLALEVDTGLVSQGQDVTGGSGGGVSRLKRSQPRPRPAPMRVRAGLATERDSARYARRLEIRHTTLAGETAAALVSKRIQAKATGTAGGVDTVLAATYSLVRPLTKRTGMAASEAATFPSTVLSLPSTRTVRRRADEELLLVLID